MVGSKTHEKSSGVSVGLNKYGNILLLKVFFSDEWSSFSRLF